MNARLIGGILLVIGLLSTGWFVRGWYEESQDAKMIKLAIKAQESAAAEIAKIQVKNTTIYNKVVEHTYHDPVYQDCKHTPEVYNSILELFK
jgi:dsRNA-specific ribonuclease